MRFGGRPFPNPLNYGPSQMKATNGFGGRPFPNPLNCCSMIECVLRVLVADHSLTH